MTTLKISIRKPSNKQCQVVVKEERAEAKEAKELRAVKVARDHMRSISALSLDVFGASSAPRVQI